MGLSFSTELFLSMCGDIISDFYAKFGYLVTEIYAYCVDINQIPGVAAVCAFSMLLGASLCSFVTVKQLIGTYGIGTEGDPDADPAELIFRLCKALGFMGVNSWLFTEMLKFSIAVGKDITKALNGTTNIDISPVHEKILNVFSGNNQSPAIVICSGALVVAMIIYGITAALRGAELTFNKILLPIFCLDIINANPEKWKMFIFQYGIGFFSYIAQMLCFNMYIIQLLQTDINNLEIKQAAVLFGWLILSIKTPSWLERYIYATGAGKAISNGTSRLGQVVMMIGTRV